MRLEFDYFQNQIYEFRYLLSNLNSVQDDDLSHNEYSYY